MKIKLAVCIVFFAALGGSAFGQGIRLDATTVQEVLTTAIPSITNVLTVPASPQVAFCNFPANAVPCTNKATTFTNNTLGTPCSTSTQITPVGSTTCVASPDANGNFGFWAAAGQYAYTVTLPGGINLGPYNVTLGIPAGTNLTLGAVFCKTFENVRCADQFAGADLGTQIAAAYSDLPAGGGTIFIPSQANGTCWTLSTAVVFNTLGKYVTLEGLANGGDNDSGTFSACVLVSRTIAGFKAFKFDNAANKNGVGHNPSAAWVAMRNLTFLNPTVDGGSTPCTATGGCGSQAILVDCGDGTNSGGCYEASFENVAASGFGKVWNNQNNFAVQVRWSNGHFQANTQIAQLGGGATGQQLSGILFEDGQWAGNGAGIVASTGTTPELKLSRVTSFGTAGLDIDYTLSGLGAVVDLDNVHLEGGTNSERVSGNMDFYSEGGSTAWDASGGTHDWIYSTTGNKFILIGTSISAPVGACPANCLTTGIINANGGNPRGFVIPYLASVGHFGPVTDVVVAGTKASKFTNCALNGASSNAPLTCSFEGTVFAPSFEVGTGAGFIIDGNGAPSGQALKSVCYSNSTAAYAIFCSYNNVGFFSTPQQIGSGAVGLANGAINTLTCAAAINVPVTGMLTTDRVFVSFAAAPSGAYLTGLTLLPPDTAAGSFNIRVCNPTAGNLTPPAINVNWSVLR